MTISICQNSYNYTLKRVNLGWGHSLIVEHRLSIHDVLDSILCTKKKKKGKFNYMHIIPQFKKIGRDQVPVAHVYNPCYSEGRDQEDHGLRPAQANVS
jgi:hypothetical protein